MSKKAEERRRKKQLRQEKFEESNKRLVERILPTDSPRVSVAPVDDKNPRVAPHLQRSAISLQEKIPKQSAGTRFPQKVTWCDLKSDRIGEWSWGEKRAWSEGEWTKTIKPAFESLERHTWGEIDQMSSGTGHKMHHGHELTELRDEAQRRWLELGLEEYGAVFRFRIGGPFLNYFELHNKQEMSFTYTEHTTTAYEYECVPVQPSKPVVKLIEIGGKQYKEQDILAILNSGFVNIDFVNISAVEGEEE